MENASGRICTKQTSGGFAIEVRAMHTRPKLLFDPVHIFCSGSKCPAKLPRFTLFDHTWVPPIFPVTARPLAYRPAVSHLPRCTLCALNRLVSFCDMLTIGFNITACTLTCAFFRGKQRCVAIRNGAPERNRSLVASETHERPVHQAFWSVPLDVVQLAELRATHVRA